jgi:hypothetical protein
MLVDKKFIYISLPRCGSTSFHYSCLLHNLSVQNLPASIDWEVNNKQIDLENIDENNIMDVISHGHERLSDLQNYFGNEYPVIAVNRERHERFYSLYKHIIFEFYRSNEPELANKMSQWELDDLFSYSKNDIKNKETRWNYCNSYLLNNGFIKQKVDPNHIIPVYNNKNYENYDIFWKENRSFYLVSILDLMIAPYSYWHNNNKNIIWFDIKNIVELEEWVSNIINKPFKIKKVNSSNYINCKIKLDDDFIKKYDNIYDYYDLPKKEKTLI